MSVSGKKSPGKPKSTLKSVVGKKNEQLDKNSQFGFVSDDDRDVIGFGEPMGEIKAGAYTQNDFGLFEEPEKPSVRKY